MRRYALTLSLIATILALPTGVVHAALPTGTPSASAPLFKVTVDELPPDHPVILGIIRSTFLPGGELSLDAGEGPTVMLVESGSVVVAADGINSLPHIVCSGETEPTTCDGNDAATGHALIIPMNGHATIRNAGATPATTLTLFSAENVRTTAETGIEQAILVRLVTVPPPMPLTLTLARTRIEPAERFALPPDPIVTVLATVERSQAFSLSGDEINRGKQPIDVYVLTLGPGMVHVE